MTVRAVPAGLLTGENLPSLPSVAFEVLRLCRQEDTTLDDLADAIARDPALSAKLLRYSNSSLFNLGAEVTTLQRAALVLGMKSVQLMSLSFSFASSLPRHGEDFDYDRFWRRSLASAVAARTLTSLADRMGEDEAFLCGLLGDLGQLVLAQGDVPYESVVARAAGNWPSTADELAILGYHRGDVARELLALWKLPTIIHLGVGYMHAPDELPEETPPMVRGIVEVLFVAGLAADVLMDASGPALAELERRANELFALNPEQVGAYLLALEQAFREVAELLDLPIPTDRSHADVLAEARQAMLAVGLRIAGELRTVSTTLDLRHRESIPGDSTLREPRTGLIGAEGFEQYLRAEIRARRLAALPHAFGVLRIDVDDFGALSAGESAGAHELERTVATVLTRMTRKGDVPVRIGEGRFAVLVPTATPFGLRTLAERIRIGVSQQRVHGAVGEMQVTVSTGGACIGTATQEADGDALLRVAERYLERIATNGGDATQVHATVIQPSGEAA
jgi:diguanylate cyclase (GGDEF)-like protein